MKIRYMLEISTPDRPEEDLDLIGTKILEHLQDTEHHIFDVLNYTGIQLRELLADDRPNAVEVSP